MTMTLNETDEKWYNNPDRPCKGVDQYGDLALVEGTKSEKRRTIEFMQRTCLHDCPVLRECRIDALSVPEQDQWGLQAGIIFRRG